MGRGWVVGAVTAFVLAAAPLGGSPEAGRSVSTTPHGVSVEQGSASVTSEMPVEIPRRWRSRHKSNIVVRAPSGTSCSRSNWQRAGRRSKRVYVGFTLRCRYDSGAPSVEVRRRGRSALRTTVTFPAADPTVSSSPASTAAPPRDLGDPNDYKFLWSSRDPSGWDPCTPVDIRVNLNGVPETEVALVQTAIDRTAAATGLSLRIVGTSTTVPTVANSHQLPAEAGIVFAFANAGTGPDESDFFLELPDAVAVAGSTRVDGYTEHAWVAVLKEVLDYSGGPDGLRVAIYMHELAHTMGLDHAKTEQQIMYPVIGDSQLPAVWGAGDATGLGILGKIPCRG